MKYYSIQEVADMFGLTYKSVWLLVKSNKVKHIKLGGSIRIPQEEVDRMSKEGA